MTSALNNITAQIIDHGEKIAEHGARLAGVEKQTEQNAEQFTKLQWWLISILATGAGALALQVFQLAMGSKHP